MNGRQARRQRFIEHARLQRAIDQARQATPQYVGALATGDEVWTVGTLMAVIPALREDYPPDLKTALDRRRRATLTGQCDCGGQRRLTKRGQLVVEHAHNCPATDDNLVTRHGMVPVRWS